jgi:transcriptional regulator with XRE-family HTH domain
MKRRAAKLVAVSSVTTAGDTMPDPSSLPEIGARLAVTRKALGLTQTEMDRRMGSALTNGQAYNAYETGRHRIPTHHALALCRTCNITLDWIYRGQMHSLQPDICAKLEAELDRLP